MAFGYCLNQLVTCHFSLITKKVTLPHASLDTATPVGEQQPVHFIMCHVHGVGNIPADRPGGTLMAFADFHLLCHPVYIYLAPAAEHEKAGELCIEQPAPMDNG